MSAEFERVNYHGHCDRCRHAGGSVREYAEEAERKGLTRYGFSDHIPYPGEIAELRMPYEELEDYFSDIWDLKREYAGRLEILCGLEAEYIREKRDYYESLLADGRCEYLLLGQHFFWDRQGEKLNTFALESTEQYEEYSINVVEAMRTGYFRYLAHPDLIFINNFAWDIHCERACDLLIDGAVKYGFALEYNANGMRRGIQQYADGERYPYPVDRFWDKVVGTGIAVYVGSDCHSPRSVYDDTVVLAYEHLKEKGITPAIEF